MSEAEVLYSDVKFTKDRGRANVTTSPPTETPYSEVRTSKKEPSTELPGSQKQTESSRRCSAPSARAALLVLSALLAACVVALGLSSDLQKKKKKKKRRRADGAQVYKNSQTHESLQKLKDEHEAVKRNLTEKPWNELQRTSQRGGHGAHGAAAECAGLDRCWERHRGKCYYFSNNSSTWQQSRDECRRHEGDLVKIDSGEEQTFLELRLRDKMNFPEDKFWIGLTDSEKEGTWLWADGSALNHSLTFWSPREPDNWRGEKEEHPEGEDCVRMGEKAGAADLDCWFDKSCNVPQRHICEKQQIIIRNIKKCVKPNQVTSYQTP